MPCTVCTGTLQSVGVLEDGRRVFHCGRCGRLRVESLSLTTDYVPRLVERCREFEDRGKPLALWEPLGIHEAIRP